HRTIPDFPALDPPLSTITCFGMWSRYGSGPASVLRHLLRPAMVTATGPVTHDGDQPSRCTDLPPSLLGSQQRWSAS
ncbi:hypothetical protein, partial [Micromonospora sp. NPDC049374]|uniref:hypothetical protein n=1 Tax=Micromonospora sp. NPDC049374 TaxID=3154352 RepID=UPI0034429098